MLHHVVSSPADVYDSSVMSLAPAVWLIKLLFVFDGLLGHLSDCFPVQARPHESLGVSLFLKLQQVTAEIPRLPSPSVPITPSPLWHFLDFPNGTFRFVSFYLWTHNRAKKILPSC